MKYRLSASIESRDSLTLFDRISSWPEFQNSGLPINAGIGHEKIPLEHWRRIRDARNPVGGIAIWDDCSKVLATHPIKDIVSFQIPDCFDNAAEALNRILPLNFSLVALGPVFFDEWLISNGYQRWGFPRDHVDHGWGCLFRGTGHDRLVSRRWLDFGPWRVVYLPNDTTFIQFHDLAITDPREAYEQAKCGHQRMGIHEIGGYIGSVNPEEFSELEYVVYYKETHLLELVVAQNIEVTQWNMWIACALRIHYQFSNEQEGRVDRIAYVFMKRSDAESHLHELWLRELECWYVDERGKHRLDQDYHPTPRPPAWVAKLSTNPVNALPEGLG